MVCVVVVDVSVMRGREVWGIVGVGDEVFILKVDDDRFGWGESRLTRQTL